MNLIALIDDDKPALDLGRALTSFDIIDSNVMAISEEEDENLDCYTCRREIGPSSGVLTLYVLCVDRAPCYVCFECVPFENGNQFGFLVPEVQQQLIEISRDR